MTWEGEEGKNGEQVTARQAGKEMGHEGREVRERIKRKEEKKQDRQESGGTGRKAGIVKAERGMGKEGWQEGRREELA